ncbi:hypothetical protein BJG92_00088 [Arthrobacter sp. SO5]|nr:hypothetical protein [Arthrobacter sp. SO5]
MSRSAGRGRCRRPGQCRRRRRPAAAGPGPDRRHRRRRQPHLCGRAVGISAALVPGPPDSHPSDGSAGAARGPAPGRRRPPAGPRAQGNHRWPIGDLHLAAADMVRSCRHPEPRRARDRRGLPAAAEEPADHSPAVGSLRCRQAGPPWLPPGCAGVSPNPGGYRLSQGNGAPSASDPPWPAGAWYQHPDFRRYRRLGPGPGFVL